LGEKEPESQYPMGSLHDFLYDVEKELKRFRRISIIGIVTSLFIIVALGRFVYIRFPPPGPFIAPHFFMDMLLFDLVIVILALTCIFYSIYALVAQNAFLKRWGERFKRLQALEQKLIEEKE
jgi:Ni/Fe-hydrogenase subunit HybB-like protein